VPTKGRWANDRYAAHYCAKNGWRGRRLLTEDEHTAIDQQLSHLTTQRRLRKGHNLGRFSQKAVDALIVLSRRADPKWQEPLQDILAKTEAEQRRFNEAWNPVDLR
jgi:hypothetical protein